MSEGTPKAIEMKGITRNATKIGVQDGQAEDLINLRFMDGSWRASGNGRQIVNMPTGTIYQQLYVHTNIYHHLLGVDNGTLYWFAEIDNDGVTFYPLDGTTDRSLWPDDKQGLPTERVPLTTVTGSMWVTQTGHLLTIIDEADDFEHFVFKTGEDKYIGVNMDVNGKQTDRSLYPFGKVHFNLLYGANYSESDETQYIKNDTSDIDHQRSPACVPKDDESTTHAASQIWHSQMLSVYHKATEANRFTAPFLIIAAIKLYDGSYAYATNPILLNPLEKIVNVNLSFANQRNGLEIDMDNTIVIPILNNNTTCYKIKRINGHSVINSVGASLNKNKTLYPIFTSGAASGNYIPIAAISVGEPDEKEVMKSTVVGTDIAFSIEDVKYIIQNKDVFSGLSIFITPQSFLYKMSADDYKEGVVRCSSVKYPYSGSGDTIISNISYYPKQRTQSEILYELLHSPFFLLREYDINEISQLQSEIKIDLSDPQYKDVLLNISAQKRLNYEASNRTSYIPKVSYMYNSRLHIADYQAYPFYGFPIDLFNLHNHYVQKVEGAWFPADADGQRILSNLTGNHDSDLQYSKSQIVIKDTESMGDSGDLINAAAPYFLVKVYIDTAQGLKIVSRYISAYDPSTPVNGRADFIEDLNPLLTYPDARANKMEIYYVDHYIFSMTIGRGYYLKRKEFTLKPHPYMNMAYYIDPELKPIKLSDFDNWPVIQPIQ